MHINLTVNNITCFGSSYASLALETVNKWALCQSSEKYAMFVTNARFGFVYEHSDVMVIKGKHILHDACFILMFFGVHMGTWSEEKSDIID